MTATERLRAMLDERGIEYIADENGVSWHSTYHPNDFAYDTAWYLDTMAKPHAIGALSETTIYGLTPEQAIAVTVGTEPDEATMLKLHDCMNAALLDMQEELLAYHPRDRENASSKKLIDCVIATHQIIEDAATAGVGTCHMEVHDNLAETEGIGEVWLECDKCHWQMPLEPTTPRFKYCPNCRAEIREEAE